MTINHLKTRGVSVVELVIYIGILTALLFIVINMISSISRSSSNFRANDNLANTASLALERISREIRESTEVAEAREGMLSLIKEDDLGNSTTTSFSLVGDRLSISVNGVETGAISTSRVRVVEANFTLISGSSTDAVRTSIILESGDGRAYKSESFYTTSVLRKI